MNFDSDGLDPELSRALEALREEPIPEPDWEGFHQRIVAQAQPVLAGKGGWFDRMPRGLVGLAAAAGIAVVLWGLPQMEMPGEGARAGSGDELVDEAVFVDALADDISETEFRMLVTGRSNPEALLAVAVSGR